MTSADRVVIVLTSVLLAFFLNVLYDRYKHFRDRDERLVMALRKLHFLAIATEAGVANERSELSVATLKDLVSSLNDLSPSSAAMQDFEELCRIVMYLDSGGYEENHTRQKEDLGRIKDIKKRCEHRV